MPAAIGNRDKAPDIKMTGSDKDLRIKHGLDMLLVMAPSWGTNMPPLGLEYINAYLRCRGYSSEVFDMNIDLFSRVDSPRKRLWSFDGHRYWVDPEEFVSVREPFGSYLTGYIEYILSLEPHIVGFSINAGNRLFSFELIKRLKEAAGKRAPLIIIGGPLCRFEGANRLIVSEFLEVADIIAVGEGEHIAADVISCYKERRDFSRIPGVIYSKAEDPVRHFAFPEPVKDLNTLPFPSYGRQGTLHKYTEKVLPLLMGRGCLGRCSFCDARFYQPNYRVREASNVFAEIKHHIETTGIRNFTFNDLAVNWDLERLEELCDLIIADGLDIAWNASVTIRKGMTRELLAKIEASGCSSRRKDPIFGIPGGSLVFGLESGSDKVLGLMRKRYTAADAEEVLRLSHEAGIQTVTNFIVGFPGETEKEHNETLEFIRKNRKNISRTGTLSLCYIPDFTELKSSPEKFGIIFPESDPMYNWYDSQGNTYEVRKKRAMELMDMTSKLGIPPLATTLNYGKETTIQDRKDPPPKDHSKGILLVVPPPWGVDVPPLGAACLQSFLEAKGVCAEIFDLNIELYNAAPEDCRHLWGMNYGDWWHDEKRYPKIREKLNDHIESLIDKIAGFPQDIIGFSLPTNCPDLITAEVIKRLKARHPDKKIILGGVSISIPEQREGLLRRIEELVDYCVTGEGEEALYRLLESISRSDHRSIPSIQGILTKGRFYEKKKKAEHKTWKDAPFPTFRGLDLKKYTTRGNSLPIEFSRGCVGNCPFCDFKHNSPLLKSKSPQVVLEQIRFYLREYSINHLTVVDSAVNSDINNLTRICDSLIENDINVRLSALAIPRKGMDHGLLARMRRAGFYRLEYGLESGSDKILKAMRKIFTSDTAEKVIRDTRRAGIDTYLYIIVGYPQETDEDFNDTKEFLKRNARHITMIKSINPLYIMAGSEMFYDPGRYNIYLPPENSDREWRTGDGNTYDLRKNRVLELKRAAREENIPFTEEAESLEFTLGFSGSKKRPEMQKGDIVLAICPPWGVNMPPLGIAYLSRYLRAKNILPRVYDINAELFNAAPDHLKDLWLTSKLFCWTDDDYFEGSLMPFFNRELDLLAERISSMPERIIGFSVNRANIRFTVRLAKAIKRLSSDKTVIFGGHACAIEGEKMLIPSDAADILILGEGELPLFEAAALLKEGRVIDHIDGCEIRKGNGPIEISVKEPIWNLDAIPFPDFTEFSLSDYKTEMLPLLAGRGCVNRCSFCNDWMMWPRYRTRSAKNIFDEILHHVTANGVKSFEFVDLALSNNVKELEALCELLLESRLSISWIANFAVRSAKNPELFDKMKRAGCTALRFGIESGSDNILRKMNKHFTAKDAIETLQTSHRAEIENHINIIVGFPGEAQEDFADTVNFITQNKECINRIANIHPCYLTPSSKIEKAHKEHDIILPEKDFAVTWHDKKGNTYECRKERASKIAHLAEELDISFEKDSALIFFEESVKKEAGAAAAGAIGIKTKRKKAPIKWLLLACVTGYTFFYMCYFWIYMRLRNKALLGGTKK